MQVIKRGARSVKTLVQSTFCSVSLGSDEEQLLINVDSMTSKETYSLVFDNADEMRMAVRQLQRKLDELEQA